MPPERDALDYLEYGIVRGLVRTAELLPAAASGAIADGCGTLLHAALRRRTRIARAQMAAALGLDPDSRQVAADVRASFRHFMRVPLGLVLLPKILRHLPPERVLVFEERGQVDAAIARRQPIVFVTAHLGNWEVVGALAPRLGVPIVAVARPVSNAPLDAEMKRMRERFGQKVIGKDGAGLPLARALKHGSNVALLIDQHAGSRGVRIPFFHEEASTFTLAAELARRFGALFVPLFSRVEGPNEVRGRFEPAIECDFSLPPDEDAYRMTLAFHRRLEAAIRATPSQYFWFHRRWKSGGHEPDPAWRARYADVKS